MRAIVVDVHHVLRRCVTRCPRSLQRGQRNRAEPTVVHLDDDGDGRVEEPLSCVRRTASGVLYADDAGTVSKSAEGIAKMTTVIVTVFEAAGLTVSEKNNKTMLLETQDLASRAPPFDIEAAGQMYEQTTKFLYLSGVIHEDADLVVETKRRARLVGACYKRFGPEPYVTTTVRLSLKVHLLKAEVIETLLYGCVTRTLNATRYDCFRQARFEVLRRVLGFQRRAGHALTYAKALKKAKCESIETIIESSHTVRVQNIPRIF